MARPPEITELQRLAGAPLGLEALTVDSRPELDASIGDLAEMTHQALRVLSSSNGPPRLFLHGDLPIRLHDEKGQRPRLVELTADRLRYELVEVGKVD